MTTKSSTLKRLNRFTTLPVLLDLLARKKLVLLDPSTWEDKNDSGTLEEYVRRKGLKRVHALCFTHDNETIYHWKAFSDGISGCCIEFDAPSLCSLFDKYKLRHGRVSYKRLNDVRPGSIAVDRIPFTKRWPYRCENEYRVIHDEVENKPVFEMDIDLHLIRKVTISQKMPKTVYRTINNYLRTTCRHPETRINRSTVYENAVWLGKFRPGLTDIICTLCGGLKTRCTHE